MTKYEPPHPLNKLPKHLLNDPIHRWRAMTGIELIHEEPTWDEFKRICKNWILMTSEQKQISDAKSIELFGVCNMTHARNIIDLKKLAILKKKIQKV